MATCQICQREFAKLRFQTEHINICTRCVNTLNDFDEPAINAQQRIREMLSRGMLKRATTEQHEADEQWKRTKAVLTLKNFEQSVDQALPGWLNRLLAKPDNTTKNYKQMRAHRRGLLRLEEGRQWTYPGNWSDVARRIRGRDGYRCIDCGDASNALHVHHIVYLSKYGTNQQSNLVTLCRPCHEKVHGREFDMAEADDPESLALCGGQSNMPPLFTAPPPQPPLQPPPLPLSPPLSPPLTLTPISTIGTPQAAPSRYTYNTNTAPLVDTQCPRCQAQLRAPITRPIGHRVRCPVCEMVYEHGVNDGINLINFEREKRKYEEQMADARKPSPPLSSNKPHISKLSECESPTPRILAPKAWTDFPSHHQNEDAWAGTSHTAKHAIHRQTSQSDWWQLNVFELLAIVIFVLVVLLVTLK